jgi:L-2-hydroxyglutarate oxidase LhgO
MATEQTQTEIVVAGAGVIGLAVARALAKNGHDVLVLEAENHIGSVTSARNSGVIHAGIYYPPGSLKAELCVRGRRMLYDFAVSHGVPHKKCGKLIVATDTSQISALEKIHANALTNGVENLRWLDGAEAMRLEPQLACVAAILSPETGVIDTHSFMLALQGELEAHGGAVVCRAPITGGEVMADGFRLAVGGDAPMMLTCKKFINAAGLGAQKLAASIAGIPPTSIPPQFLAKGSYFSLSGAAPFNRLIYPMPVEGSQGLHYSFDTGGRARFGPDIEWVDQVDYRVDPARLPLFKQSIKTYWPCLPAGALQPDYAGMRPKLARKHGGSDFMIQAQSDHGIAGLLNLYGIESPGLTASLAVGEVVNLLY